MIEEGIACFDANMTGPQNYLKTYENYLYIINGEAEAALKAFFEEEPFPYLKVNILIKISSLVKNNYLFLRTLPSTYRSTTPSNKKLYFLGDRYL